MGYIIRDGVIYGGGGGSADGDNIFHGTQAEWNALTTAEKAEYDFAAFTDDYDPSNITNPNLLDNPWFTVNQRGQSSYTSVTSSVLRSVDRWISRHHTNVTVNADGTVTFTEENDSNGWFAQRIESERIDTSKNYTFSFMLQNGTIYYATGKFPSSVSSEDYPVTDNYTIRFQKINDTYSQIVVIFSQNSSITVKAIKLELGAVSTLALDTAPNYATELLKCQRYFYRKKAVGGFAMLGNGIALSATNGFILMSLPTMRTAPTITFNGTVYLWDATHTGGSGYQSTAINSGSCLGSIISNMAQISFVTSGMTVGTALLAQFRENNSYIDFSADL